jgi:hypothetical protein
MVFAHEEVQTRDLALNAAGSKSGRDEQGDLVALGADAFGTSTRA